MWRSGRSLLRLAARQLQGQGQQGECVCTDTDKAAAHLFIECATLIHQQALTQPPHSLVACLPACCPNKGGRRAAACGIHSAAKAAGGFGLCTASVRPYGAGAAMLMVAGAAMLGEMRGACLRAGWHCTPHFCSCWCSQQVSLSQHACQLSPTAHTVSH